VGYYMIVIGGKNKYKEEFEMDTETRGDSQWLR
jgi:hypothetical protein